ncbi:MAG TPA: hypothetical protein VEZ41_07540, partial [Allosphingosinicella sp.]|nr:hypothetical protein [Allosphingosinicella sp.]
GRRSRGWWRALLDQYGASDVLIPEVQVKRAFPGGPAVATFIARYGPDAEVIGSFELRADTPEQIPQMMAEGVQRMDSLYVQAFNAGFLQPNPTLVTPREFLPPPPPPPPTELLDEAPASRPRARSNDGVSEEPLPSLPPEPQVQETPVPIPSPQPTPPPAPPGFGPRGLR